ncbi:hypothetical protein [Anaerosinus sp.]|uniref:hypothetical protein n=1 Tax=Selenobaculum sp. TaxID=3074374 RepID=UPI0015AF5AFD
MKNNLLDLFTQYTDSVYLSDLRKQAQNKLSKNIINKIYLYEHSLYEWNEAVNYITGCWNIFESREEAKTYLLNFCENNRE